MLNLVTDNRELRSFRLRYKIKLLFSFFKSIKTFGAFFFCEVFQPRDHINYREECNKYNLKFLFLSKKLSNIFLSLKEYSFFRNLLSGGLVLIRDRSNAKIKENNFEVLLKNNKFFFRFLY
jgi:hypothetical protein